MGKPTANPTANPTDKFGKWWYKNKPICGAGLEAQFPGSLWIWGQDHCAFETTKGSKAEKGYTAGFGVLTDNQPLMQLLQLDCRTDGEGKGAPDPNGILPSPDVSE